MKQNNCNTYINPSRAIKERMLTCQLKGGLGNQLFQIFATIACAIENHHTFRFLDVETLGTGTTTIRPTYWTSLLSNLRIFLMKELPTTSLQLIKEPRFTYTPIVLPPSTTSDHTIMLCGYYQSEKYFKPHYSTICRLLSLSKKREKWLASVGKTMDDFQNTIALHFRIGDYKRLPQCHPLAPVEYYSAALRSLLYNIKNNLNIVNVAVYPAPIYYFCEEEDVEEVNAHIAQLSANFPEAVFLRGSGDTDWEQMLWMSCCNHTIIANSTFSWWAAYFNPWDNKRVYYPSQWFGPAMIGNDTRDLIPDDWIQIKV